MIDKLIKNDDIQKMDISEISKIYNDYINPGQVYYFKLLGFNKTLINHAQGCYYINNEGENILDFAGGVGSIGLGHNHPRIISAREKFTGESRHEIGMSFYSQYVAALSKNLSTIAPGDLKYIILGNTGSEVMEQAIKMVEKYQGPGKHKIIYAKSAFHGRTKGALSITDSNSLKSTFKLVDNGDIKVKFGDANELELALKSNDDVGGVVLESIQGGAGIIIPPEGYLKRVRELCDQYGVLYIADEIQCGFGRTGKLFAFEHDEVIPDIVTLSKSLGGGKAAVAAAIIRENIYKKAYKEKKDWYIQLPSTFGGMGEACVTANEAINILYEEKLIENAMQLGKYFLDQLTNLQEKYPTIIKEVRGKGFMLGIEFHDLSQSLKPPLSYLVSTMDEKLKGSITGFIGAILLNNHNIVAGFTEYNRNVLRLHPPLIAKKEHIDYFIEKMDSILSGGITGIIGNFIKLKF